MIAINSRRRNARNRARTSARGYRDPDWFGVSLEINGRGYLPPRRRCFTGLLEQVARLHLQAAAVYSRHGASQAAYRSIVDAENIAHEIGSPRLLAEAYGMATSTACEEGDPNWAIGAAERAISVWKEIGESPPAELLSNLGVARMRLGQHEEAATDLRGALAAASDQRLASTIRTNCCLSACRGRSRRGLENSPRGPQRSRGRW